MPANGSPDETIPAVAGDPDWLPPEINVTVAHPARVYDYLLGGKDNFAADRARRRGRLKAIPSARGSGRAEPRLPRPCRPLPGRGGGHQAVPRHRHRHPHGGQHARGRAGGRAGEPDRLRGQRPDRAGARAGPDHQRPRSAPPRSSRQTCATGPDPRRPGAAPHPGPRRAGRPDADRHPALRHGRRRPAGPGPLADGRAAVGQLPRPHPSHRGLQPGRGGRRRGGEQQGGITFAPRSQAEVAAFFDGLDLIDPGVVPILAWHPDGGAPADPRGATTTRRWPASPEPRTLWVKDGADDGSGHARRATDANRRVRPN